MEKSRIRTGAGQWPVLSARAKSSIFSDQNKSLTFSKKVLLVYFGFIAFNPLKNLEESCKPPTNPYNTLPYKQETPSNPSKPWLKDAAWVPYPHRRAGRTAPIR